MRVYALAKDADDRLVRVHDGPTDTDDDYPYSTRYIDALGVQFSTSFPTILPAGNHSTRWTMMGAFAESLYRYADGLPVGTQIHVAERPTGTGECGLNYNYENHIIANDSYIVMQNGGCSDTSQRQKAVVAHEYGHAYLHQRANKATTAPSDTDHSATPQGNCSFESGDSEYYNNTKEWSSLALREGAAHFISARIWNDVASEGQLRWGNSNLDLERWSATNPDGGVLVNECCPYSSTVCASSLNGAGTITDWMRALWDLHTESCGLNKNQMGLFYSYTINRSNLTNSNFFAATEYAASLFETCIEDRWAIFGCRNGIDREGAIWLGC